MRSHTPNHNRLPFPKQPQIMSSSQLDDPSLPCWVCQARSSKGPVQLSTAAVSSECDQPLCYVQKGCLLLLFRTSDSHHLSTSSSVMVLQPWRKKLKKVVLFGDWEPHRHLFSAQWLNLKVFYSPWKGRIQAGRSLILQCRAEHQVSW